MVTQIGISIDDWLFKEIETRRGEMNRSEFCSEMIIQGMGLVEKRDA